MGCNLFLPLGCLAAFLERHAVRRWPERLHDLMDRARQLSPGDPGYDALLADIGLLFRGTGSLADVVIGYDSGHEAAANAAFQMLSDRLYEELQRATTERGSETGAIGPSPESPRPLAQARR